MPVAALPFQNIDEQRHETHSPGTIRTNKRRPEVKRRTIDQYQKRTGLSAGQNQCRSNSYRKHYTYCQELLN